mgnify:CR=1 FL=1
MNNSSLIKKIKLFNYYKKIIDKNKEDLKAKYYLRIDNADRMYTVLNIPEDLIGEAYSLKTSDIDRLSERYVKEYSKSLSDYLDQLGLNELHDFYKMDKVGKYSYLIVFGYSLFKSHNYYNYLYFGVIPFILITLIVLYFIYLF